MIHVSTSAFIFPSAFLPFLYPHQFPAEHLGVLLAVLSLILIFQGIRQLKKGSDDGKAAAKGDTVTVVETIAVIIAYTLLLQPLGFCLSTVLFLFGMMISTLF